MGGNEACFDKVCKVKYRISHLKDPPQYIVVQALQLNVVCTASAPRGCTRDEGRSLGVGLQEQASNHLKVLW